MYTIEIKLHVDGDRVEVTTSRNVARQDIIDVLEFTLLSFKANNYEA